MFVRTHRILFWCFALSITAERYVLCVCVVFYTANPFGCNAWCVFQVLFRSLCESGEFKQKEKNRVLFPIFCFLYFFKFRILFLFYLKSDQWFLWESWRWVFYEIKFRFWVFYASENISRALIVDMSRSKNPFVMVHKTTLVSRSRTAATLVIRA